jgi:type IV pilus assembly protein PilW
VTSFLRPPRRRAPGFSLVEIMVGMVIGMFGIIIMLQVFSLAESQKRATSGGGDAQTTGAIALYGIQRDMRQSGHGISDAKLVGCSVLLRAGVTLTLLAPVTINHALIPAGDANTDTLLVTYGSTNGSTQGDGITSQASNQIFAVQTPTTFTFHASDPGKADKVLATPSVRPSPCNLILDPVTNVSGANVTLTTGMAGLVGGTLFNVGLTPKVYAYAIRNGNLTVCDYTVSDCSDSGSTGNAAIWVPIANNVVRMRAQYGRDTTGTPDGFVDTFNQTALASACDISRISAIRIALVVRSVTFEKTAVTTDDTSVDTEAALAPNWDGGTVQTTTAPTNPTAVAINLALNPDGSANATWKNYRYRVFQSVVPLRNIAWQGAQSGC